MVLNKQTDGICLVEQQNVLMEKKEPVLHHNDLKIGEKSKKYLVENSNCIQYLDLKFCNDALTELI